MKAADQSILQLLAPPKKIELTPSNIAHNTGLSRGYVSERLSVLVDQGLVKVEDTTGSHPYYGISKRGEAFLKGEVDPDDLNKD